MQPVIRRATRADVPAIRDLYAGDYLSAGKDVVGSIGAALEAFDDIEARPDDTLYVAEIDGRVVGTLQLTILRYLTYGGARVGLIEAVHVAESERNRGIGRAMMRAAIEDARHRGCNRVQLTSNKQRKDAHRFYERLGFVASHEGFKLWL
ncbi:MAG TPA: GNAT family N-acetyltransferase [Polyangiaceae bacterium]|nr:GNAT family N-acetyltransferase [Polyangiaceae bacterium]